MVKLETGRLDQDINFSIKGIQMLMQLDTTAPFDLWVITPKSYTHKGKIFKSAVNSMLSPLFSSDVFRISDERASIKSGTLITKNIFRSLPEWDGCQLAGLFRAEEFARFFNFLKSSGMINEFQRSDGSVIEYESFLD